MNPLDALIIILVVSSLARGYEIGMVRQFFSTTGFFAGLLLGAVLQPHTVNLVTNTSDRTVITIFTTLGMAIVGLAAGEVVGAHLKRKIQGTMSINRFDGYLGSVLGSITLVIAIWLATVVLAAFPSTSIQHQIRGSYIIARLDRTLPPAPSIIAGVGHLIDPNGFPQVFTGNEPSQAANTNVPGIGPKLQAAIDEAKLSTVKIEGVGCGGIVDGSGFVVGSDMVATNAHVVAGVRQPYVNDSSGQHSATVVWFDPALDFAVLRAQNLAGPPLLIANTVSPRGANNAVLGYPGGGPLAAGGASIIDNFTARGRDIYGQGLTERDVYSLAAKIIPGNSGGPVINADATVVGIVFARSTSYDNVGYALTSPQILPAVSQAQAQNRAVSSGSCAE